MTARPSSDLAVVAARRSLAGLDVDDEQARAQVYDDEYAALDEARARVDADRRSAARRRAAARAVVERTAANHGMTVTAFEDLALALVVQPSLVERAVAHHARRQEQEPKGGTA